MNRRKMVIVVMALAVFLRTVPVQAESPAVPVDELQMSGEFLEFLGEIDSSNPPGFDLKQFDELFQMLKMKIRDVIDAAGPKKDDESRGKEGVYDAKNKN